MKPLFPDTELEFELQELYILSKHWMQDIFFVEGELRFFKNILSKYLTLSSESTAKSKIDTFEQKIRQQEINIADLKENIKLYLTYLEPYINDDTRSMDIALIEKFTNLQTEINNLFASVKNTKSELFACTEQALEATESTPATFPSR